MQTYKLLPTVLYVMLSAPAVFASPFDVTFKDQEELDAHIMDIDKKIANDPNRAALYLQRADAMFLIHDFETAGENYTKALQLQADLVEAFFGRGLALARAGRIKEGITDLDIYITRRPNSSLAYTKRGVRYLWISEYERAKSDLEKAIALDATNAEAHDDLGVVYAQRKDYVTAAAHFATAISLEPSYQKAWHNMAVVGFISGNDIAALGYVNKSLQLAPQARSSMLLKSQILSALGRLEEAAEVKDEADFLPEGNWSENVAID